MAKPSRPGEPLPARQRLVVRANRIRIRGWCWFGVLAVLCASTPPSVQSLRASDLIAPHPQAISPVLQETALPDSFDPYAPVEPETAFAEWAVPAGEISLPLHTRYGVVVPELPAPWGLRSFVPRAGVHGTLGSHTQGLQAELGLVYTHVAQAGTLFDGAFTADFSETLGMFGRQWSYEFAGVQSKTSAELVWTSAYQVPYLGGFGLGWRVDWFLNRSFEEIGSNSVSPEDEHHHLDQRLGTIILQHDRLCFDGFRRFRFEFQNDVDAIGGDGGDQFRTANIRFLCLRQAGAWQRRCGISLEFFTGETDLDKTVDVGDQRFYDMTGLAFSDRSQGLLEFEFGLSYFHYKGCHLSEIGFDLELGPDTEEIRDVFQNRFVHERITGTPFVAKVDRPSRFKADLSVYYIVHF
jgi:hypothetical protein